MFSSCLEKFNTPLSSKYFIFADVLCKDPVNVSPSTNLPVRGFKKICCNTVLLLWPLISSPFFWIPRTFAVAFDVDPVTISSTVKPSWLTFLKDSNIIELFVSSDSWDPSSNKIPFSSSSNGWYSFNCKSVKCICNDSRYS